MKRVRRYVGKLLLCFYYLTRASYYCIYIHSDVGAFSYCVLLDLEGV